METIEINKANAIKAYNQADGELKDTLGILFGRDVIGLEAIRNATECKTWEDICTGLAIDPVKSLAFLDHVNGEDKAHMAADFKLKKFSKLCWKIAGKTPDLKDSNQPKWYPYFYGKTDGKPSSFGFSYSHTYYDYSDSFVGLRLSYPDERTSDYAGKQFEDWYRDLHVVVK